MNSFIANVLTDILAPSLDVKTFVALRSTCFGLYDRLRNPRFIQNAEARTQRVVWEAVIMREDVLLLGPGGCGKTYTLQAVMEACQERGLEYAITSSTGISACNFKDGRTLHSFSKLGLALMTYEDILDKYEATGSIPGGKTHWNEIDLLLIDEISMVGKRFFEKIDLCAKLARDSDEPFGGLQLVCSGDYLQLPPVMDKFVFLSPEWRDIPFRVFYLEIPVRQNGDLRYFDLLQRIRLGEYTRRDLSSLERRKISSQDFSWKPDSKGFYPPKLYPQNKSIEPENKAMFKQVPGKTEQRVEAEDLILRKQGSGYIPTNVSYQSIKEKIPKGFLVKHPKTLHLKKGAQYFLTFNLDVNRGLVNGAICLYLGQNRFLFRNGKIITCNGRIKARANLGGGLALERVQLPFKLGYAVTIHSSQGMTLDKAVIDLGKKIFSQAQVYVALSRVRRLKGVYLLDFDPKKIRSSKQAIKEYRRLEKYLC